MIMKLSILSLITTAASAATIDVKVGSGGLNFQPDSFAANEGDSVVFHIYSGSGSHSVALSAFDTPCQPASGGFYSGILMGDQAGDHTYTINITTTTPQYIYCSVGSHCQNGMVAILNPPSSSSSQDITAYKNAAKNAMRASPPSDMQGGVVATGGSSASASAPSSSMSMSMSMSSSMTMTSSSSSSSATAKTTSSSSRAATATTSGPGAATTTSTSAGQKNTQRWSTILGMTVLIAGVVALMS